jgi:hypothetical protein
MESFFLAETLKYLHLLFDPDSEIDILNKVRGVCTQLVASSRQIPYSCLTFDLFL